MTSPGGREVGRVSVRVSPDTSKFRKELREQLRDALKDIVIPVAPDGNEFQERLREIVQRAQRDNKVEIPVEFDQDQLNRAGRGLREALTNANMPDFLNEMSRLDVVMRNVVANATRIRQSLERASNTMRDWTRSALNIRSHFEGISRTVRNLPGHIGLLRFGPIENGIRRSAQLLQTFGAASVRVFRSFGSGVATAGRTLSRGFGAVLSGIGGTVASLGKLFPRVIGGSLVAAGDAMKGLGGNLRDIGTIGKASFGAIAGAVGNVLQSVIGVGLALVQIGAVATAVVVAGAAIAAAWGAAAAAMAAIPALIALVGIPLGLMLLDFETLKKRVGELSPAFQQFRKDAANALADGIAPAMETFANRTLPKVRQNLLGIATTMGQLAQRTSQWLATEEGVGLLNAVFANVDRTIKGMTPGLADIGNAFLKLAGYAPAFNALTGAVNTFGAAFRESVDSVIADKSLERAFTGLQLVLESLGRAFVGLVENGIKLFAGAAPGLSKSLDSLTNFFDRFDWEALGKSVGDVFQGLGESLDKVDQSTIDAIVAGFERLGDTFRDPAYQQMFTDIIESIPTVLDWLNLLVQGFLRAGTAIIGLGSMFSGVGRIIAAFAVGVGTTILGLLQSLDVVAKAIQNPMEAINGAFTEELETARQNLINGFDGFGSAFEQGKGEIDRGVKLLGDAFAAGMPTLEQRVYPIPEAILAPLRGIPSAINTKTVPEVKKAVENLGGQSAVAAERAMQDVPTKVEGVLQPLPGMVGGIVGELPGTVRDGLSPIPDEAVGIFQQLEPGVRRAFAGLSIVAFEGMGYIRQSVQDGLTEIETILSNRIGKSFGDTFRTAFEGARTAVATEMTNIVTAVTDGVTGVVEQITALTTAITDTGVTFVTFGQNLTDVGIGFQNLNIYLTTLNTSLTAANVTVTTINTSLVTLNTNLTTLGTNLVTINTNVTTLNASLVTLGINLVNLSTSLTGLNLALPLLITNLRDLNTAIVTLNTTVIAFTQNLQKLLDVINLLIPAIRDLITALTDLNTAFVTLQQTIETVMQAIVTAVTEGLITINTAWAEAVSLWVDLVTTGMASVVEAITQGMADSVAEVEQGVQDMVAVLADAEQQFFDAGAAMGQGLVDGLKSKLGAVKAAAQELANAAAAATRAAAEVASPSRVFTRIGEFLGDGLSIGIDNGRARVARSAQRLIGVAMNLGEELRTAFSPEEGAAWTDGLVDGANSAVSALSSASTGTWAAEVSADDFGGVAQAVAEGIAGWTVQIDGNGMAKMVNKSNTRRVRRR